MSGSIALLLLYAVMELIGTTLLFVTSCVCSLGNGSVTVGPMQTQTRTAGNYKVIHRVNS